MREGEGPKLLRTCLLTDAENLDLEINYFILQGSKTTFFLKKKKKSVLCFSHPKPQKSFGKIVILRDQQHNHVKWHSMRFKPVTIWGEGGKRGPSLLGKLSLCLAVSPLMVW